MMSPAESRSSRPEQCIHHLFEARVAEAPDAIAVTHEDRRVTYAELDAQANRVAHRLRSLGAAAKSLIALCVERGVEMVVGVLGILKAGAAYVPLDPSCPRERMELLLSDSRAPIVVTTRALTDRIPASHRRRLLLLDGDLSAAAPSSNPGAGIGERTAAYVMYTSGSTGAPKGVVVEHRQVVRLFSSTDRWFGFGRGDVWTLFHSFGFDFSVWEIGGALLHGGRLVIVPSATARSPEAFLELIERERVTVLNQTPSAFQQLARAEELASRRFDLALRTIVFGGERLDPQMLRGWVARHGDASPALVNMYGITETTVHVTYRRITEADTKRPGSSPIGVPIGDLYVRLLDDSGKPVAKGQIGEIHVGGAGVARGYLDRPELTALRFMRDPFSTDREAVLYKSGDLAFERPNGELVYVGRTDEQLKIRGYRVEPGEIESCLRRHRSVSSAVVVARDHGEGDKTLVAYVVPSPAPPDTLVSELAALAAEHLPAHTCPASYVLIEEIPLTTNGKVDRAALPAPDRAAFAGNAARKRLPASDTEKALADIWQRVLGIPQVGLDDDFFDLGGTSLGAVKVLVAVKERLGVSLHMSLWADVSTVAGFAGACSASARAPTASAPRVEESALPTP